MGDGGAIQWLSLAQKPSQVKIEKNVSCNRGDFGFVLCLVFCLKKCISSLCSASGKEWVPGLGKKSVHFLLDLTATVAFLPSQNLVPFPSLMVTQETTVVLGLK